MASPPPEPRHRGRRNRRAASIGVVALRATFLVPALAIVLS